MDICWEPFLLGGEENSACIAVPCFVSFFPMGLCYFVLISYFEFWTRVFFMRLFLMDLLTVRHRILVKFSYTILEDGFFANL